MFDKSSRVAGVALVVLGLAWTASVAQAAGTKFQARGTFQVDFDASHGNNLVVTGEGEASLGGSFDTMVWAHDNSGNYHETGVQLLDFGHGNTLTISFEDDWVPDPDYPAGGYRVGPYVITDGTGKFAGASGGGTFTGVPNGDGTGAFYLDGTISW